MKEPIPIVTPDGVEGEGIAIGSEDWLAWLDSKERKSFHYRGRAESYTVSKRSNGKWYGVKKQRGSRETKQEYIGASEKVTEKKLEAIASLFAMPDFDYWRLKHPLPEKKQDSPGAGSTSEVYNQDQATPTIKHLEAKVVHLVAEVQSLKETVVQLTAEKEQLQHQLYNHKCTIDIDSAALFNALKGYLVTDKKGRAKLGISQLEAILSELV